MTSDTPRPPMTQSEPVLTATRTYQCPGCWSVTQNLLTPDGYECECGERLSVIDLRAAQSPVQPVLSGLDVERLAKAIRPEFRDRQGPGGMEPYDPDRLAYEAAERIYNRLAATAPAADEGLREAAYEVVAWSVVEVGPGSYQCRECRADVTDVNAPHDPDCTHDALRAALATLATPNPEQDRCTCPPDDEVFTAGCPVHDGDLR